MKRILFALVLLAPSALPAQTPTIPNQHASAIAKQKVAAAMVRRATHMRGEAIGLDNRPVTPATPATHATRAIPATPHPGEGPATRATPASPSHRPTNPGAGHGRRP